MHRLVAMLLRNGPASRAYLRLVEDRSGSPDREFQLASGPVSARRPERTPGARQPTTSMRRERRAPSTARRCALPGIAGLAALLALAALPASACRYSVRDTGFVDLDQPPWLLRLSGIPESQRELWQRAATSRLLDSNLRLEPAPAAPGDPAATAAPTLTLVAPDQRTLVPDPDSALPATPDAINTRLEGLLASSVRDQLHDDLLRAFAVIFLVEGTDGSGNASARRAAEEAIRAFTPLLGSLPKPVDTPPRLISLPSARIAAERVLVWSLGFHPEPVTGPRIAVLYGRGRPIGPPLEGPFITRTSLEERLTLIGQDCECDLDRSWLQSPVFAARWDAARQTAAARALGFDPENPLVRTEVTRIVLRGPLPGQARRSATSGFDTLALGYREEAVDGPAAAAAAEGTATNASLPDAGPPPAATRTEPARREPEPAPAESEAGRVFGLWFILSGTGFAVVTLGLGFLIRALRSR